jgi:hypothetical protein
MQSTRTQQLYNVRSYIIIFYYTFQVILLNAIRWNIHIHNGKVWCCFNTDFSVGACILYLMVEWTTETWCRKIITKLIVLGYYFHLDRIADDPSILLSYTHSNFGSYCQLRTNHKVSFRFLAIARDIFPPLPSNRLSNLCSLIFSIHAAVKQSGWEADRLLVCM